MVEISHVSRFGWWGLAEMALDRHDAHYAVRALSTRLHHDHNYIGP